MQKIRIFLYHRNWAFWLHVLLSNFNEQISTSNAISSSLYIFMVNLFISAVISNTGILAWGSMGIDLLMEPASSGQSWNCSFFATPALALFFIPRSCKVLIHFFFFQFLGVSLIFVFVQSHFGQCCKLMSRNVLLPYSHLGISFELHAPWLKIYSLSTTPEQNSKGEKKHSSNFLQPNVDINWAVESRPCKVH